MRHSCDSRAMARGTPPPLLPLIPLFAGACGDDGSIDPGDDAAVPTDGGLSDSRASPDDTGEGNLSEDPLLDAASENPFTPHNEALRTATPISDVNYGFDDHERDARAPTVGACEMP